MTDTTPAPAPEEMSPEFTDSARSALLWVLWHHQGASSKVGQPIRFALGMGAYDRLNERQIQAAKGWDAIEAAQPVAPTPPTFQQRIRPWMQECFGSIIAGDKVERNHRFLEESLELVQACGCTESEATQLVAYVYGRPVGDPPQEVGGVMVTLAALCLSQDLDMHVAGETELARIWTKVEQIRAKQASKPKHSPLPASPEQ